VAGATVTRIAVYDAHWATGGGGEKYAGGVAEVLSRHHEVVLLAHEPVDTQMLGERLALDLARTSVEVVDPTVPLERVTAGFDLLVNASYRSHGRNGARRGIYVVHFPDRPGEGLAGWQRRLLGVLPAGARPTIVEGFHEPDIIRWQQVRWTNGRGVLRVDVPSEGNGELHLWFGRFVPGGERRTIQVSVDGALMTVADLAPPSSKVELVEPLRVDVPVTGRRGAVEVVVESDAVVAHDVLGNGDRRRLGVPLVGLTVGRNLLDPLRARASLLSADRLGLAWLDSYDLVVSNSVFTQGWVDRWWGRPSEVLEPPVGLRSPGEKDQVILSVGRFFAPGRGHAKKQLEMVEAFRRLVAGGLTGWELHLVGGCSPDDRPYFDEVEAASAGLPVVLHPDATGAEVDELYRRAAIYWHATGLDEDIEADPVRAEHFGITTVEAMSAGAVPVVIATGGQPEVVRAGVDGLTFTDLDGMVRATRSLIDDPQRRAAMAAAAGERAQRFGMERFGERLLARVEQLGVG